MEGNPSPTPSTLTSLPSNLTKYEQMQDSVQERLSQYQPIGLGEGMLARDGGQRTLPSALLAKNNVQKWNEAWTQPFQGDGARTFQLVLEQNETFFDPTIYYAKVLPIIQSSGMGKSRLIAEFSRLHCGVIFTFRTNKQTGYPPGDSEVTKYSIMSAKGKTKSDLIQHSVVLALLSSAIQEISIRIKELQQVTEISSIAAQLQRCLAPTAPTSGLQDSGIREESVPDIGRSEYRQCRVILRGKWGHEGSHTWTLSVSFTLFPVSSRFGTRIHLWTRLGIQRSPPGVNLRGAVTATPNNPNPGPGSQSQTGSASMDDASFSFDTPMGDRDSDYYRWRQSIIDRGNEIMEALPPAIQDILSKAAMANRD
ncbi:hypothetical protein DFH27DRAFT_529416 [Peziza echinospora]|nr:hypothetical protein DFH27DRAFT_529416 [Peziza echinospora]